MLGVPLHLCPPRLQAQVVPTSQSESEIGCLTIFIFCFFGMTAIVFFCFTFPPFLCMLSYWMTPPSPMYGCF